MSKAILIFVLAAEMLCAAEDDPHALYEKAKTAQAAKDDNGAIKLLKQSDQAWNKVSPNRSPVPATLTHQAKA